MKLSDLDSELLGAIWPPDRIHVAVQSSRVIAHALRSAPVAIFKGKCGAATTTDPEQAANGLLKLSARVELHVASAELRAQSSHSMEQGTDGDFLIQIAWHYLHSANYGSADRGGLNTLILNLSSVSDWKILTGDVVPLASSRSLARLSLYGTKFDAHAALLLSSGLRSEGGSGLEHLEVGRNDLSSEGLVNLCGALQRMTKLEHLGLGCNLIDQQGVQGLESEVPDLTTLTSLTLGRNRIDDSGAEAISRIIGRNPGLRRLDLESNRFKDIGVESIGMALSTGTFGLTSLLLGHNRMEVGGAQMFAISLRGLTALQELDIAHNLIGPQGATAVAEGLRQCLHLNSLHLGGNKLGDEGAEALGFMLSAWPSLSFLSLRDNKIGDDGISQVVGGLKEHSSGSLLHLDIAFNSVTEGRARLLADTLGACTQLRVCDLGFNSLSAKGVEIVKFGLQDCRHLERLETEGNTTGLWGQGYDGDFDTGLSAQWREHG